MILFLGRGGSLFEDDSTATRTVLRYAQGRANGKMLGHVEAQPLFYRPLIFIARHINSSALALQSIGALISALVPIVLFVFLSRIVERRIALVGSILIAVYPSQVLFSSIVLKDPYSWLALAGTALSIQTMRLGTSPSTRVTSFMVLAVLLIYLYDLRFHTFIAVVIALLATIGLRGPESKQKRTALICLLLAVPVIFSISSSRSPLDGWGKILEGTADKGVERLEEMTGANTSIDCRWLLYSSPDDLQSGWTEDLLCLPPAAKMFLLDPLPNQVDGNSTVALAMAENVLWYPLLIGFAFSFRRWRNCQTEVFFVLALTVTLIVMWSLIDRNFGTAFRHRGEVLWGLTVLSSVVFDGRHRRRTTGSPSQDSRRDQWAS